MNPTRLRSWIRRYGNAGVLLVGGYLVWRHLWTYRRASLIASLVATGVLALWLCAPRSALKEQPSTPTPAPAVATHFHFPAPPLRNIRAVLLKRPGADDVYYEGAIGAVAGKQILWKDVCYGVYAWDDLSQKTVYYVNDSPSDYMVVARRYDGRILWRAEGLWNPTGIDDICMGGNALFVEASGPTWGVEIAHPEYWEGKRGGVIRDCDVTAVNSRNGVTQWKSYEAEVGRPLWTDGTEFLDVRVDMSARAMRRVDFGACLPVWLELRRVSDHHRLWRRRLNGIPPGLTSVRRIRGRRVKFVFANKDDYGMNEFDFVAHADETAVVVPLDHSAIESGGLQPRVSALITPGQSP